MKKTFVLITATIFSTSLSFAQTKKTTVPAKPAKPVINELELKVEVDKEPAIFERELEITDCKDDFEIEKVKAVMSIVGEDIVESNSEKPTSVAPKNREVEIINVAFVDDTPRYKGGDSEMYKWLSSNIQYPPEAVENGITGKVIVSFVVEKDGQITNVHVVRSKHPALDEEAVRVVSNMPNWEPALINGEAVRVEYNLPISFNLKVSEPVE